MEKSIGSIVTKIDAVLAKLETMERGRNKRKATMSKILGTITESDGRKYYEELDLFSIEFCFLDVDEFTLRFLKEKARQFGFLFSLQFVPKAQCQGSPKIPKRAFHSFFSKTLILYFSLSISHLKTLKRTIENGTP